MGKHTFSEKSDYEENSSSAGLHHSIPSLPSTAVRVDFANFMGNMFKWSTLGFGMIFLSSSIAIAIPENIKDQITNANLTPIEILPEDLDNLNANMGKYLPELPKGQTKDINEFLFSHENKLRLFETKDYKKGKLIAVDGEVIKFFKNAKKRNLLSFLVNIFSSQKVYILEVDDANRTEQLSTLRNFENLQAAISLPDVIQTPYSIFTKEIDYLRWQQSDSKILLENISDLYEEYFNLPRTEQEWDEIYGYFIKALAWSTAAVTSGVIGNLAYDILKNGLNQAVSRKRKRVYQWKMIQNDFDVLLEILIRASKHDNSIRVIDVSRETGINKERVKLWFKLMGGRHTHAGENACTYQFKHIIGK